MAMKFSICDRVSSTFMSGERFGTVVRLERGMPVVRFDDGREMKMSRSNCLPITRELVAKLAARESSELNASQVEILANNRMLLEQGG